MFDNVFTSTQLKTNLREVKEAAEKDIVYISENGVISYVLCSVEIYNRLLERVDEEAVWKVAVEDMLLAAGHDYDSGRTRMLGERVRVSRTFEERAQKLDFAWETAEALQAIEYLSEAPEAGLEVPNWVYQWHPVGDHARKYFCEGYDLIYEHDDATGDLLLCGVVEALESFEYDADAILMWEP